MSVQKRSDRAGYRVRWLEGSRHRSRTFDRKADADTFEREVRRRRQMGGLESMDAGTETLADYVLTVWAQAHAATLAPKTRETYTSLYDLHIDPLLGDVPLRSLTSEAIAHWQSRLLATGRSPDTVGRSFTLLGSILQRATEARRIPANPQRLVRRLKKPRAAERRTLAPATVERLRAAVVGLARKGRADDRKLRQRDAVLISLLAYAGLRPQEARGLTWGHVRENTLLIDAPKTGQRRTVRLLSPLRQDLAEWRLACGRPSDREPVIPAQDGGAWSEIAYEHWRAGIWLDTLAAAGVERQRPYDLRHSFASLLLHEGRSVIYVARQLGHGAALTMSTYGHVIDELEDAPNQDAETAVREARSRATCPVVAPSAIDRGAAVASEASRT